MDRHYVADDHVQSGHNSNSNLVAEELSQDMRKVGQEGRLGT